MTTQTIAPQVIGDEELQTASGGFAPIAVAAGSLVITACTIAASVAPGRPAPPFSTLEMIVPYYASKFAANAVKEASN